MYDDQSFEPVSRLVQNRQDTSQIKVYHYHNNHLGTPQELTDDDGNVIWANYEWAWGGTYQSYYKEQSLNNCVIIESDLQPIRFQGQSLDIETGLHYNRFRYYDSDVGMFIQRDPIGLLGGVNVFAYAPNPILWVDPWGLKGLRRPYIRNSTREAIEAKANIVNGRFLDANTGLPIPGGKRRKNSLAEGKYDLGHKPGHEHWRMKSEAEAKGMTQKEFNDLMNNPDFFQIEDPMENQSHRHENKTKPNKSSSKNKPTPCIKK